jgi:hypothetical protein
MRQLRLTAAEAATQRDLYCSNQAAQQALMHYNLNATAAPGGG